MSSSWSESWALFAWIRMMRHLAQVAEVLDRIQLLLMMVTIADIVAYEARCRSLAMVVCCRIIFLRSQTLSVVSRHFSCML